MLCRKFELIPTSIFQVMAILRKCQNYSQTDKSHLTTHDTVYYSTRPLIGFILKQLQKFVTKSNFDQNHLKLFT